MAYGELIAMEAVSIAAKDHPTSYDIITCKLAVTEGNRFYCVSDTNLNTTPIPEETAAITMKQTKKLGSHRETRCTGKRQQAINGTQAYRSCITSSEYYIYNNAM